MDPPSPSQAPRDEVLDESGRLRGPWRRVLGSLLGMGTATLRERRAELDRAFADEAGAPHAEDGQWRCDPIPFLFTETEFNDLAARLAQRASVLEALLADVYGPRTLLQDGTLPPSMVYPSPRYIRACRTVPAGQRHLHLYAADLIRSPQGEWQVVADRTDEPSGLGYALENRRLMARVLPEAFHSMEVAPLRPFVEALQASLHAMAPAHEGSPGLVVLTPGQHDPRWFEHVVMARELGCALVEAGDLTVRGGALWVKTLRGLLPVHVLLRRQGGAAIDPLELHAGASGGIPGLLTALRAGTLRVANGPGAGYAESPGLAAFLPVLSRRLLGENLALPSVVTAWLGDPVSRARVEASLAEWHVLPALDSRAQPPAAGALRAAISAEPWAFAAIRPPVPSVVPCAKDGERLHPCPVMLRLFLIFDGTAWRPLPGGVARVLSAQDAWRGRLPPDALSKDVWVLMEEGADIMGPGNPHVPNLPVRRTAADMPSRVADNFFWFGRYLERLETAARLTRAMLVRLSRAGLLPRDLPELKALTACLVEADVLSGEVATSAGTGFLAEMLLRAMMRDSGALAHLTAQVQSLAETLRDRLSAEMYTMVAHGGRGLKGARLALRGRPAAAGGASDGGGRGGASLGVMADLSQRVLEFSAAVSGYAAENMVRGGGRLFLDLGRRIERGFAITTQLAFALEQPPERIEAGLLLALELCDSMLTYRNRYAGVIQPALVLDLVLADQENPRGLAYQLISARDILLVLDERADNALALMLAHPVAELSAIIADVEAAPDQAVAASELPARLRVISGQVAALSNALRRQYFTLLPAVWTESAN
jgi:uncharacterized circularly permuted ATP-grasp superfamily protein/uncharacterized alpha-E superfamily protein